MEGHEMMVEKAQDDWDESEVDQVASE